MSKHQYYPGIEWQIGTVILDCTYVRGIGYFDDVDKVHITRVEVSRMNHLTTSWQEFRTMHDGTQCHDSEWIDPMTGDVFPDPELAYVGTPLPVRYDRG